MSALGVVETLQVAEDAGLGLLAGLVVCALNLLSFQSGEERLNDGVVITVPFARHTLPDTAGVKLGPKGIAGVLAALVRMMR